MGTANLTLVVPLLDEEERLAERGPELVAWAAGHPGGADIVLVDDGSTDRTVNVASDLQAGAERDGAPWVRILSRPHEGKGAAVTAGIRMAATPFAGFCDVDLSTPLDQYDLLVKAAERELGLVIASRDAPGAELVQRQSARREWLGRQYNRLLRLTLVPGINDTQCGAKVAPTALWRDVLATCAERGLAWDVEVIATARRRGYRVVETPVSWAHDERSRVRCVSDGAGMVAALPRIALRIRRARPARAARPLSGGGRSEVFDAGQAQTLVDHADHWWFRAKAAAVSDLLGRHPPARRRLLVDLGAGAGAVTAQLSWPGARVAADGHRGLAAEALGRGTPAVVGATEHAPLAGGAADAVCLLDVIEHLDDPVAALGEARRLLRDDGRVVVTVPAHDWLWSEADELLGHRRRYQRRLLAAQLREAGFEPIVVRHLFSWLVPPVWVVRRARRKGAEDQLGLGADGAAVARMAALLGAIERRTPGLPVGTSVIAIARPTARSGSGAAQQPDADAGPVTS